ncbi:MAG: hypothetical protein E7159_04840 [Firmicutes bacterium]|nr:hypothetical protein [Bacillota bacterium]
MKKDSNNKPKKKSKVKKILLIILLIIVLLVVLFFGYRFIKNKIDEKNAKKYSEIVSELNKDKISYVFVEINPHLVLTIKDNKVNDIACLNDDCLSIYKDLDIKGKDLDSSIDVIYNVSKEKGFDTSNGIKLSSTDTINIKNKENITIEYIDTTKEKELLNDVKNNETIKEVSNEDYYTRLWNELKKDKDYGNVYTCNMNNKELECYITLETGINNDSDYDMIDRLQDTLSRSYTSIMNTLKKFNYNVDGSKVIINGIKFGYVPLFTNKVEGKVTKYKNVLVAEIIDKLDNKICERGYADYRDGKCEVMDGTYIIALDKLNLVRSNILSDNIIELRLGATEHIMKQYNIMWRFEKEQQEKERKIRECIPQLKSKGYYCCNSGSYYLNESGCHWCTNDDYQGIRESTTSVCHVSNVVVDVYGDGKEHEDITCVGEYQACGIE